MSERIAGVALRHERSGLVCSLPAPNRHHHVIRAICAVGAESVTHGDWTQGFVTDAGRFVDRKEAAEVAFGSGQTTEPLTGLMSEDVW